MFNWLSKKKDISPPVQDIAQILRLKGFSTHYTRYGEKIRIDLDEKTDNYIIINFNLFNSNFTKIFSYIEQEEQSSFVLTADEVVFLETIIEECRCKEIVKQSNNNRSAIQNTINKYKEI